MDENLKESLGQLDEIYVNAVEGTSKIVSEQPLLSATDRLLCILIQVEVTNGCILKEILSLLNTPKEGDANG